MFALASPGTHQNQTFEQNNLLPAKKNAKPLLILNQVDVFSAEDW
jgi:hypothetical protein